jgi:hypothetical protein
MAGGNLQRTFWWGVGRGETLQEENRFVDQGIDGRVTSKIDMNERRWKDFDWNEQILGQGPVAVSCVQGS